MVRDQDVECCCSESVPEACELPTFVTATGAAIVVVVVVAVAVTVAENCYNLVFNTLFFLGKLERKKMKGKYKTGAKDLTSKP